MAAGGPALQSSLHTAEHPTATASPAAGGQQACSSRRLLAWVAHTLAPALVGEPRDRLLQLRLCLLLHQEILHLSRGRLPLRRHAACGRTGEHSVEDAGGSGGSGGGGGALWALWPNPRTSQQPRSTQSVAAGSARGRRRLRATVLAWPDVTHFPGLVAALVLPWRADDQPRASIVDQ